MKIVEKNAGRKISYKLTGTTLELADGALALDLARYQQDDEVTRDIMADGDGFLTTGRGRYYVAQVEIPARRYDESVIAAAEEAGLSSEAEQAEGSGESMSRETIVRTALPLDTDDVTLYLFAIDGILIR